MKVRINDDYEKFYCDILGQWKYIKANGDYFSPCSVCNRKRCSQNIKAVVWSYCRREGLV